MFVQGFGSYFLDKFFAWPGLTLRKACVKSTRPIRLGIEPEIRPVVARQILNFVAHLFGRDYNNNDVGIKVVADLQIVYSESEGVDGKAAEGVEAPECYDLSKKRE